MYRYIFIVIVCLSHKFMYSQQEPDIDPVEIKIVKDYNVFIEEATKIHEPINYYPKFKDKASQKKIIYNLPDRIEQFKFIPSSVEPIAYKQRNIFYNNTNFVKAGFGSAFNPIFEWSHHNEKSNTPSQVHIFHHSSWKSPDSFQKYSETNGEATITKSIKNWIIKPKLVAQHKYYNFFGNVPESGFKNEATRNYFNGGLQTTIQKEKSDLNSLSVLNAFDVNYGLDQLNIFDTTKKNHEFYANVKSDISYKFRENLYFKLQANVQYYNLTVDTFTDKWIASLMPHGEFRTKTLKISGGLNLVQTFTNSKPIFYVLPNFVSEIQLIPSYLNFITIWNRNIDLNRMQSHLNQNPFALFSQNLLPNSLQENRTAGLKGVVKGISYQAHFNQRIIKNALLFKNDVVNPRFLVSEIERNLTINNVSLELSYAKENLWSAFLRGEIFLYELDRTPAIAYNLPGQRLTAGTNFKLGKKVNLQLMGFMLGGVKTEIAGQEVVNPILFDLNLGVEYLISKNFYIFANGNNLLDTKISQQVGYNSIGINGQGGIRLTY